LGKNRIESLSLCAFLGFPRTILGFSKAILGVQKQL
jgi:hypothetical protein